MLRVPINLAQAGMVLALPIYHPKRSDTVLLNADVELEYRIIKRLEDQLVHEVWIRYPGLELLSRYIDPKVIKSQAEIAGHVGAAIEQVTSQASSELDFSSYQRSIVGLIEGLIENPKAALFVQEMGDRDKPGLQHGATVSVLSVLIGLRIEDYVVNQRARLVGWRAKDLSSLGVGGMLHDLGMLKLEKEVRSRWNKMHDEEDQQWRAHVRFGYKMIQGAVEPSAASAVLHHHQRFDGTGFPLRKLLDGRRVPLKGKEIHIFARIVAAADLFDRLRHPVEGVDEKPVPMVRVLRQIQQEPYCNWLDPVVVSGLLSVVPPYVPGSMVELSNGVKGVVVAWNPQDPCRPVVQRLDDLDPKRHSRFDEPPELYDLGEWPDMCVVRAEDQYVEADNFYKSHDHQYDIRQIQRAMFGSVDPATTPPKASA